MLIVVAFAALIALALAYLAYLRPYLERAGIVRELPGGSVFARLRGYVRDSITIAWGYLMQLVGLAIESASLIDREQVRQTLVDLGLGEWFGVALVAIGVLTVLARLRSVR